MEVLIDSKQDFFANIPPEIMIEIFARIPIPIIIRCKCVCKSWLDLVKSLEFVKSHFSKSVNCLDRPLTLVLIRGKGISEPYEVLESVDTQNSGHHWDVVFKFSFPRSNVVIHSSVDGLLLLFNKWHVDPELFICNPVTREYIKLPPIPIVALSYRYFGFGVSKLTRKYKVVMIYHTRGHDSGELSPPKCEVYTLGTGSWRSVPAGGSLYFSVMTLGVFLNGNLHWLARERNGYCIERISCFNLETECFSTFSVPHHPRYNHGLVARRLCLLGQSLCLCDHLHDYLIDIWLMNKYGDDKSWTKVCSIKGSLHKLLGAGVVPIKIFKNGNVLLANEVDPKLYCYSNITRTVRVVDQTKSIKDPSSKPSIYNPSFLPLKMFAMENVSSF